MRREGALVQSLHLGERTFRLTRARCDDVPVLVALLRDDVLGSAREQEDLDPYLRAFDAIDADPAHLLLAVRDEDDVIVGTMQLTLLPGLSRGAATRLQIESVRVGPSARGSGLGTALFRWAADYGRSHGARLAQLTTDKQRADAHRFYERLGYVASHEGMKLPLVPND
ncbi:MAG: GNAT family N-acetyltransferase [Propionibacteriales bacterium]|nr:GNAT family N-acetyltransferase [Propionibacteriales bacterium]